MVTDSSLRGESKSSRGAVLASLSISSGKKEPLQLRKRPLLFCLLSLLKNLVSMTSLISWFFSAYLKVSLLFDMYSSDFSSFFLLYLQITG